jgi:hypothetical protein
MEAPTVDAGIVERTAALEKTLISEYLAAHARSELTPEQSEQVWKDALLYAALRLEEVTARAHLLDGLRGRPTVM